MKKIKLSRKELVIIDLLIFILVIKFAYEPIIKYATPVVQSNIDRVLLFIWFIVGIMLLTFCFTNYFSAIQIFFKKRKINKDSQEYIYKTQEYYIKLNNAKYFAKIFLFIYLLFNSLFVMGIIFLIYNFILSLSDIKKLKTIHSTEKEYNETVLKINSEIQNIALYSIIVNMSYFYLKYNNSLFRVTQNVSGVTNRFMIGILFIVIQIIIYFVFIKRKLLSSNRLIKYGSKLMISIIYALSSFILINLLIYYLGHLI